MQQPKKCLKVLSIDIDIVSQDESKYNEWIDEELSPAESWKVIEWKLGRKPRIDPNAVKFLEKLVKETCNGQTEIVTIERHHEAVEVLERAGAWDSYLINVDRHHDIDYGGDKSVLDIGNWVMHARNENLVRKYTWIHADDSALLPYHESPVKYSKCSYKDLLFDKVIDFDLVIVCKSPYYTPPAAWYLMKKIPEWAGEGEQ